MNAPPRRPSWRLRSLLALLCLAAVAGSAFAVHEWSIRNRGCDSTDPCTRIFFIGNSYTSVNDLPTTFSNLAWSGGHRVETGVRAPGGWTLNDHANSTDTTGALHSGRWDFVVLQEQSATPAVESLRVSSMYPAARRLVAEARSVGASPLFFVTWAHRDGLPEAGMPDYSSMQGAIDSGYLNIAREQHAALAPVGVAWLELVSRDPHQGLWQDDGSHPTDKGTYLAACVLYAAVFLQSPVGLGYHSSVSDADAAQLQAVAADVVLSDRSEWGL